MLKCWKLFPSSTLQKIVKDFDGNFRNLLHLDPERKEPGDHPGPLRFRSAKLIKSSIKC